MQANAKSSPVTFGDWLALYLTGLLLVAFMAAHIWAVHYAAPGETGFTFDAVRQKLQNPLFAFLDLGMLALVIYHGLVGLRRFIVDLEVLSVGALRMLSWGLLVLGVAGLYYGWLIYRAFVA